MPYRVRQDGIIECDSADEALSLQATILSRLHSGNGSGHNRPPPSAKDGVAIVGLGRSFLKLVLNNPGIKSEEAAPQLGKSVASFPPMHRSIRAWARGSGIDPDRLFVARLGERGAKGYEIDQQYRSIVEAAVKD